MLELDRKIMGLTLRTVYFAEQPSDMKAVDWLVFSHIRRKVDAPGFSREEWINAIVELSKGKDHVWNNMAGKCRAEIRKSEKDDLTVKVNDRFEDFIILNQEFRKAKGLPPVFEEHLHPPLPRFCSLFTAELNGDLLGGLLFIRDEKEMYGMLGASRRLQVAKEDTALISRANRRLWWEAAQWGIENGIHIMDMGNFPSSNNESDMEGVGEFKRRFGAEAVNSYVYRKTYTIRARIASSIGATVRRLR